VRLCLILRKTKMIMRLRGPGYELEAPIDVYAIR